MSFKALVVLFGYANICLNQWKRSAETQSRKSDMILQTLGGVTRNRVTHAVCWYCASPPTPKGETAGVALFFGQ